MLLRMIVLMEFVLIVMVSFHKQKHSQMSIRLTNLISKLNLTNLFKGIEYKLGQELPMCGGCIILNCTSRPCTGRNGEKCELFWTKARISEHCCQTCEGKVMEPNQELPPRSLHDECGTKEHTLCKAQWHSQSNSQVGSLEVSFTATDCCNEKPLGTRIVEPESCSFRTCRKGLSAFWERTFLHVRYSFI